MAIDSRTYILDRIKSRKVSIEEFNFDKLTAPPISLMFTPQDIQDLYYIAHSIKLSSHPEKKFQYIDDIMSKRGFVKFIGGTNRVSYRPIEDNSFLVKVAIDDVGRSDNPREFRNQHALKPFVTKVFEVTPCGTLGVFERVVPITNRQEYMSVAEDIFTLINEWLIGEYVMDDIGSNYFMNYGIRKGFGVVLLDYPYMYKVDYNKLFCALEDKTHTTMSGKCEGEIDYDDGYNKLVCTKCGARYKAIDLAKAIDDEKVIIKGGFVKMALNINISGGSKNVNERVEINNNEVAATPSKPIAPSLFSSQSSSGLNIHISRDDSDSDKKADTQFSVNGVGEIDESVYKNQKVEEEKPVEVEEEKVVTDSQIESPVVFHEEGSKEIEAIKKEAEEKIKEVESSNNDFTSDTADDIFNYLKDCNPKEITKALTKYIEEYCHLACKFSSVASEEVDGEKILRFDYNTTIAMDDDEDNTIDIMDEDGCISFGVKFDTILNFLNESGIDIDIADNEKVYGDFIRFSGKIINQQEININAEPMKVIVLIDQNGNYLTDKFNNVIVIDMIDNRNISNISVVSTQWMRTVEKKIREMDEELEAVNSDDMNDTEVKEAPVGAAPILSETSQEE